MSEDRNEGENNYIYIGQESGLTIPEDVIRVIVHPSVKTIEDTFLCRYQLTTVVLGEGLEEIVAGAYCECSSLREIKIPPAVKAIKDRAFAHCSQLNVNLGEGLEEIGVE